MASPKIASALTNNRRPRHFVFINIDSLDRVFMTNRAFIFHQARQCCHEAVGQGLCERVHLWCACFAAVMKTAFSSVSKNIPSRLCTVEVESQTKGACESFAV